MLDKKESCNTCGKTVYPTEKVAADGQIFHKGCFRFFFIISKKYLFFY